MGKTTLKKINTLARTNNTSMFEAAEVFVREDSSKIKLEVNSFLSKIYKWHKLKTAIPHEELVQIILEDSHYVNFLEKEANLSSNPENLSRIDNIKEFIESLRDFENLEGFLEHVSLVMENISNTSNQSIKLMTMHSAKGLEFEYVFLAGWEEGVFPSKRSIEELGKAGLEEERRLGYVALTRARTKLYITYVNQNRYSYASHDYNIPSRFIDELPKEFVDMKDSNYLKNSDFVDEFSSSHKEDDEYITPGRKRILLNSKQNKIEWDFNQDFGEDSIYKKGTRVFHQKFGYGKIIYIEGNMAEVKFDKSSQKQVFTKYLQLIY